MRNITIKLIAFVMVAAMAHTTSYSTTLSSVEKIRKEANNASPDDWYTLAKCAEKLISKGKHLEETKTWLLQSIYISKRSYNVMVLGDYYHALKHPEKALEYYVEALKLEEKYSEISDGEIQKRIGAIVMPELY